MTRIETKLTNNNNNSDLITRYEEMIKKEIYLLLQLKHPRIIQFQNYFLCHDYVYIAMEYAKNGTLHEQITNRKKDHLYFPQKVCTEVYNFILNKTSW